MCPLKWNIIFFLSGITLMTIGVDSEPLSKEIKPSSVKECRVHIEKALEQYWDKKGPSDNPNSEEDNNIIEQLLDESEERTSESHLENKSQEKDDENDEGETDSNPNEKNSSEKETKDDDNDDDEEEEEVDDENSDDEQGEIDEKETESGVDEKDDIKTRNPDPPKFYIEEQNDKNENENKPLDLVDNSVSDEEDDNDEESDDDDDKEKNNNEEETDDENEDENDDDEDETDDDNEDETDDDNEDETDDDNEDENNNDDEELNSTENEFVVNLNEVKENKQTHNETVNDAVENEEDADNEDENEEDADNEDENEDDTEESIKTNIESNLPRDPTPDEIQIEIQIAKDKVTGEADSSSVRVESKFLDEKPSPDQPKAPQVEEKNLNESLIKDNQDTDSDDDHEDQESGSVGELDEKDDDSIENIYEEEDDANSTLSVTYRNRDHIDIILGLDETEYDDEEEKLAQSIFKDIKKIHLSQIKPMEMLYKYTDSTTRVLTDAEIFNKPMLIFLGPWSSGKTSIINYLLGIERPPAALKTGTGVTDVDFTLITYGDQKRETSGTELAADWRYTGVQKFGQGFLDHFRSIQMKHTLLKKITIVDTPGILENKKNAERGYSLTEAFQWFIDRSDAIYVVLDPTKVDIGAELGSIVDQLKGRDARFILNKADSIRRSDLMRVVGQLFWNLSPLMSSTEAPVIYAVSLTTKPYHPSAPTKFLADQEKNFFYDMKDTLEKRVENRILYARRHAVRVRNHAKMVDCYLATYYRHKSIFSSKRNVAKLIIDNPSNYNIFDGLGGITNVSRNDLPDPTAYKDFFKLHPLYDFKPLVSTCSYFRGCPMDKLDLAISKDIPELLAKYKKKRSTHKQGR